jgi:pyrophosphatase PpaX
MKPLLCFDMDETIIKSNKAHVIAFNKAFTKHRLKKLPVKRIINALQGETGNIVIKKLYPKLTQEEIKKILEHHNKLIIKETNKYAKQIDNSARVLKKLKKKYRIAILSNCTHKEMLALLKGAGINYKMFNLLIGKDEVKHAKPCPDEIFKAEKLTREKADFMIGDSLQDIKAAKKAKIKIISVLTGNTPKTKIIKAKPDYILNSIKGLPKLLKRWYNV